MKEYPLCAALPPDSMDSTFSRQFTENVFEAAPGLHKGLSLEKSSEINKFAMNNLGSEVEVSVDTVLSGPKTEKPESGSVLPAEASPDWQALKARLTASSAVRRKLA